MISSDFGAIKSEMTDQAQDQTPNYVGSATFVLSLVAAVGAVTSLLYVRKIKPSAATTPISKPPESPPPATTTVKPDQVTKEESTESISEETFDTLPAPEMEEALETPAQQTPP